MNWGLGIGDWGLGIGDWELLIASYYSLLATCYFLFPIALRILVIPTCVLKRNSQMREVSHGFKLFGNRVEKVETFT
jgi:hypothetical protein